LVSPHQLESNINILPLSINTEELQRDRPIQSIHKRYYYRVTLRNLHIVIGTHSINNHCTKVILSVVRSAFNIKTSSVSSSLAIHYIPKDRKQYQQQHQEERSS
jgi:hypothetical protein